MKRIYIYLTVMATLLIGGGKAMAQSVTIDGVVYSVSGDHAVVSGTDGVGQNVVVLATVEIDSVEYPVTAIGDNAFKGCTEILSITLPEGIVSIGSYAFYENHKRQTINFPSTLKSIGSYAFGQNYNLKEVVLSEGFETLSENAFNACSALTTASLPESVTSIGASAFYGCSLLVSVNIPSKVTAIAESTFYGCAALASLTIPATVTSVGNYVFNGCTGLKELTIADGVSTLSLGYHTYYSSSSKSFWGDCPLEKVYLGRNLSYNTSNYYGYSPFYNIKTLKEVLIGDSVSFISHNVFYGCSAIESLALPEKVDKIWTNAFYGCSSLKSINIPSGVTIINENTFYGCAALESLVLPDSITSIGASAFYGCSSLKSVNIPSGVTAINHSTFYGCASLDSLVLPTVVASIGESAFYGCSSLKSINIPFGVTAIGDNTFYGCASLTSMIIPSSVTSVGNYVFNGCTGLKELTLEDGYKTLSLGYHTYYSSSSKSFWGDCPLEKVYLGRNLSYNTSNYYGYSPFYNIKTLKEIEIGGGVTYISAYAFYNCTSLDSLSLPETVTTIDINAFQGCTTLKTLSLPETMISIGTSAFYGCSALDSLYLPETVTTIGAEAFSACSSLKSINIPTNVTVISNGTFSGCSSLDSLYLPKSITSIGSAAFRGCSSLTSFTIPSEVTAISDNTFFGCTSLRSMIIPANVTSIGNYAFNECSGLKELTIADANTTLSLGHKYSSNGGLFGDCKLEKVYYGRDLSYSTSSSYGYSPFYNITTLTEVVVGDGVTAIGSYAFRNCTSMHKIMNYSGLQFVKGSTDHGYIAYYAQQVINVDDIIDDFWFDTDANGKHYLTYYEGTDSIVALPADYQGESYSIGDGAFRGHDKIVSIQLPEGIESIGGSAFYGCSSLSSLTLPESVTSIGAGAFYNCSSLASLILPKKINSIGSYAFYNCLSLASVNIPSGVPTVGEYTFYGCASLTSLTIPASVTSVGNYAFNGCTALKELTLTDGSATLSLGHKSTTDSGLFGDCPLEKVYWGRNLSYSTSSSYGYSPFYNMSTLSDVVVGDSVASIGQYAFYGCSALDSLTIPANISSIGNYAFDGCTGLKELTFADGGTTLSLGYNGSNKGAFRACPLEKVYLGRTLSYNTSSSYGYSPFYSISTLNEVIVGDSVASIGAYAFYGCASLRLMSLPEKVGSIGQYAFCNCSSLASVNIPSRVTTIGEYTFYGCSSLAALTIPASVTSIGSNSFYGCTNLKELTFVDGGVTLSLGSNSNATADFNYGLFNCSSLEKLYLGRNLSFSTSGDYVPFKNQTALTEVVVGDSVTSIYARTFYGCSALNFLSLPETVSSIGTDAFYGCTALTYLYCGFESPQVLSGSSPRAKAVIYVPVGTYVAYKEQFPNNIIVEGEGNEITVDITLPGTLAEEVLNRVPYIRNVNSLKVSGTLNDNDIATINESMINLLHLDLSKTTLTSVNGLGHANLLSIVFPDSCKTISGYSERDNLTSVTLPDAVETLGDNCFNSCDRLAEVTMATNLKTVGYRAFYGCKKLKSVVFKDGDKTIGIQAFKDCDNLESVSFGDGVTSFSTGNSSVHGSFNNCPNLRTLIIGNGILVSSSWYQQFDECRNISEIHIPNIEVWLNSSFSNNFAPNTVSSKSNLYIDGELLTDVVIPSSVSIRPYAFYNMRGINSVTISEGVKTIGEHAFNGCYALASVTISEGVHTIQSNAFANCGSLRSITLPSTLRSCAAGAFSGSGLTEVTCPAFFPPVTGGDMIGANNCTLYVPEWTLNRYKLANNWNLFAFIEPLEGIYPSTISVYTEEALAIPAEGLAEDYKPNMEIVRYDNSNVGRLTLRGEKAMPLSTFKMEQTRDVATMTSLVNHGTLTADSVVTQLSISANNWHYLTFPYDVKISDIATLGDWVIRRYDGASRARADFSSTWQNVPYDSILHAGEGYIWYSTNGNFTVPAIENDNRNLTFANETRYTQLKEHASATEANYGWNLIGNPYPAFYDTRFMEYGSPITVRSGNSYAAYSPVDDSYILSPLEAFFVQCSADNNIVGFDAEGRQIDNSVRTLTSAPKRTRAVNSDRSVFNLYLENGSYTDHTRFVINEKAQLDYEIACDAAKFMSDDPALQQLFTIEGGERMAINERPFANGEIALGAYFGTSGSYTFVLDTRVTEMEVVLIDKLIGVETDLMTDAYTFTSEAGTFTDRFAIRMKRTDVADAIEAAVAGKLEVTAEAGAIRIVNATAPVAIYNAAGALVATQQGGDVTVEVTPGIYVVKIGDEIHKVSVIK